eukprot:1626014-Amphidinium_carterae.1
MQDIKAKDILVPGKRCIVCGAGIGVQKTSCVFHVVVALTMLFSMRGRGWKPRCASSTDSQFVTALFSNHENSQYIEGCSRVLPCCTDTCVDYWLLQQFAEQQKIGHPMYCALKDLSHYGSQLHVCTRPCIDNAHSAGYGHNGYNCHRLKYVSIAQRRFDMVAELAFKQPTIEETIKREMNDENIKDNDEYKHK